LLPHRNPCSCSKKKAEAYQTALLPQSVAYWNRKLTVCGIFDAAAFTAELISNNPLGATSSLLLQAQRNKEWQLKQQFTPV
jgi:hypothetical protein